MSTHLTPLQAIDVVKHFRQGNTSVAALRGIQLTISAGEFVAIMGASGSGKSTLLHALAGLTDIDSGQVLVDGQDLAKLSDTRLTHFRGRRIGLVFQAFNLIPSLSAEDNVRLPATQTADLDQRVDQLLERLGMNSRRSHKPGALSGGEQQRIAIARSLICEPAIVLADEPTGSLDSVTGQQICELLHELSSRDGRTIAMVTHEPHVAMWADRVVVLKDGRVIGEFRPSGRHDAQEVAAGYQATVRSAREPVAC
ncbi:Macrolide export ATP-binding/permease protein MacB [Caulifigura coniformis]|uniref:Macrolide export ATP-binding/permease protein MacB n=1 Tax=Caulifigura coniformis TaxID=2527983 RepID=A0A517S946_9PLAN|nr:ABC transporter ATP-binding protein [Caulifigura coniformis]QDT52629.1 Macrolide export ATP-binding/permease protein MacB [Caulifigura coniformis]